MRRSPYRIEPERPRPPPKDPGRPFFMAATAVAVLAPFAVYSAREGSWAGEILVVIGVFFATGLMTWFR
jgi:hypothetical protein